MHLARLTLVSKPNIVLCSQNSCSLPFGHPMTCRSGCACLMYPFAVYRTRCFAHEDVAVWEVLYRAISAMYVTTLQTTNTTVVSEPFGCIHNTAYTTVGPQLCSCLFVLSMWISEDSACIFAREWQGPARCCCINNPHIRCSSRGLSRKRLQVSALC